MLCLMGHAVCRAAQRSAVHTVRTTELLSIVVIVDFSSFYPYKINHFVCIIISYHNHDFIRVIITDYGYLALFVLYAL